MSDMENELSSDEHSDGEIGESVSLESIDLDYNIDSESEVSFAQHNEDKRKLILKSMMMASMQYYVNYMHKEPCHDRKYSGWSALMSLLNGHRSRCYENLRMHKHVFFTLCEVLVQHYGLKGTREVCVEEMLAIFLMIVGPQAGY